MFSRLGTAGRKLRADHGIYMVDSQMNIAGLNADTIPVLAKAIETQGSNHPVIEF
jgi:aromatic-amino-acid transaminase